jgi:hypothetical protein
MLCVRPPVEASGAHEGPAGRGPVALASPGQGRGQGQAGRKRGLPLEDIINM